MSDLSVQRADSEGGRGAVSSLRPSALRREGLLRATPETIFEEPLCSGPSTPSATGLTLPSHLRTLS